MNPWQLYDALIEGIDPALRVEYACCGVWRAWVETTAGSGLATLLSPNKLPGQLSGDLEQYRGLYLRDLAALVKSWDNQQAALGAAAINAYYNDCTRLVQQGAALYGSDCHDEGDAFSQLLPWARGKKVATVGHFGDVGSLFTPCCDFTVFEREPRPGDLPDAAEEYLLPQMDLVFITGMTFTNKTLPRLLQLCASARVVMVGPSTPLSTIMFDFGVEMLSGLAVAERDLCRLAVRSASYREVYDHARKVMWSRE